MVRICEIPKGIQILHQNRFDDLFLEKEKANMKKSGISGIHSQVQIPQHFLALGF